MAKEYVITGIVTDSAKRINNVFVQAMDSDEQWFDDRNDDIIGGTWTRDDGKFEIHFTDEQFKETFLEGNPDIYLIIRNQLGEIIHITETKRGIKSADLDKLIFNVTLDSLEKKVPPDDDPYEHNNERVISSFQNIGESIDISNSDTARILSLLLRTMSDWQLYTQENAWNVREYDGPQVPRYPWKQTHNHKLRWEV